MSAFEVKITPTRQRNKRPDPTIVTMAPFSAKSIVQFEDVPLEKTARRVLLILNPSDDDIEVKVTRSVPAEHNLQIEWSEKVVAAQSQVQMELIWIPQLYVACKETLQLTDNRNFRKDVMIILKTKTLKTTRKFPTVTSSSSHVKTLRLKSPTNGSAARKKFQATAQMQQRGTQKTEHQTMARVTKGGKLGAQNAVLHTKPLLEFNANPRSTSANFGTSSHGFTNGSVNRASKENISPLATQNVINLIDDLNFTPARGAAANNPNATTLNENYACLPTPIAEDGANSATNELRQLRPRRLLDLTDDGLPEIRVDLCETSVSATSTINTSTKNDKTFEVKHTDDSMVMMTEATGFAMDALAAATVLNRTTTIPCTPGGRILTMIREEESSISNISIETKNDDNRQTNNLKRDIQLVGTPLRKYSESMKDLSLKSTSQTKLAIQGSMPNLNEMETIRSIEQNRYFHQQQQQTEETQKRMSIIPEQLTFLAPLENRILTNDIGDGRLSIASNADLNFNQNEICAQSSRFNLNEVGLNISEILGNNTQNTANTTNSVVSSKTGAIKKSSAMRLDNDSAASHAARKRRLYDLSLVDIPSEENLTNTANLSLKAKNKSHASVSPPKRQRFDSAAEHNFLRPSTFSSISPSTSAARKDWSRVQPKNTAKLMKTLSVVKKPITPRKESAETRTRLYDSDLFLQNHINPDPFAATTTCDPFLASTMYLDECAVERHLIDFRKWLNALVTIPADLETDCNTKIDVGKLFNEVRNKDLTLAPSKEEQSLNYLTKFRLESLRRAAVELFLSDEMRLPCSKVVVYANKQAIRMRNDRNLHLDVVMQRNILELLLCFNPLWLRLGLEVVYGEKIHLHSNNDVVRLSYFILHRVFRDKYLEQKYSKAYTLSQEYAEHIKKFTLQKVLFLLLFLDKAKTKRIIKHNPCLFVKKSPFKETKEILLRFSSELLANVGDISRELRRLGYMLQHKQNYLDEFDYAFNNIAVDLRDGVRLTRVMEIILLRDDLTQQLRVPAISRLQRVFNVNLALRALSEADFQLHGNISAADIVDGHREKTLSLLWQIIYKFRSPKFHAAAKVIQQWWRRNWLRIVVRRRVLEKELQRRNRAATRIQALYRGFVTRRFVRAYKEQRTQAAVVLQKYTRRYLVQKRVFLVNTAAVRIQRFYRAQLFGREYREAFLRLRACTIYIQRLYRRRRFAQQLLLVAEQTRLQYQQKRHAAAACIQTYWRASRVGRKVRMEFLQLRGCVLSLQQRFRARIAMRQVRATYVQLLKATLVVQQRFRAQRSMWQQRVVYLETRTVIIKLQQRRRAQLEMRKVHATYVRQRLIIINMQQRLRAIWAMKKERQEYQRLRAACCVLQRRYRARAAMKQQLARYQRIRDSTILLQRKWRTTLLARSIRYKFIELQYHTMLVQQQYRATKLMRLERANYLQLKAAVISIQRRYRAKREMLQQRTAYQYKLKCIVKVQQRFRAYKQMRFQRAKYQGTRAAVLCLQQHTRNYLLMKQQRANFLRLKKAAICLQRTYRARLAMRLDRKQYERLRVATIWLQRRYREKLEMKNQMASYERQRQLIIAMQRRFRGKLLMRKLRQKYQRQREIIIKFQQRYRATLQMRSARTIYLEQREKIMRIQRYYRSYRLMKFEYAEYQRQRTAAIRIQSWYRSTIKTRQVKDNYQRLRTSSLTLQRKWRAIRTARLQRVVFLATIRSIVLIQCKWRAILEMRAKQSEYQEQRRAAIVIQRRYRAHLEMLQIRTQYQLIVSLIVCIQRKFRARRAMRQQRQEYLLLRRTTICIQQRFRGKHLMQQQRAQFVTLRCSVLDFQTHVRGYLARRRFQALMTPEMIELRRRKLAALTIQRYYRGYRVRQRFQNAYLKQIRRNIVELKSKSKAVNSLRNILKNSVHILRGRFNISEALNVLQRLERITRTVPHLTLLHSEFIATFCYGIMAQAIRSEIDKQMIELCSRIILNMARYSCSYANIKVNSFQQNGLVTIAQMLLRWCDKDCEIFNTLCTLVWIFAQCPNKREIIREFMTTPEALYMLRETRKLVARKEKMKQNVRRQCTSGSTGRLSQQQQRSFSSRALPSLEPDYGIIRNKPYTFISSVYAFDTVLCKLGIEVY